MDATHTLLGGAIDYAGLFPPAQLGMGEAVANYAAYRRSADAWALGRFVVPANRIDELDTAYRALPDAARAKAWPLSVLAGPHLDHDLAQLRALDGNALRVESLEIRASTLDEIEETGAAIANAYDTYVEIPLDDDPAKLVGGIGKAGLRAKMRTGGTSADAFPTPGMVTQFIARCLAAGVPFKATAGLHHLRTGAYRLTYDPESDTGRMFGYLNLLAATAVLRDGAGEGDAERVLLETEPEALRVEKEAVVWRDRRIGGEALTALRRDGLTSFGSCSFREPLDELRGIGLA
jgi:hypothetical protein